MWLLFVCKKTSLNGNNFGNTIFLKKEPKTKVFHLKSVTETIDTILVTDYNKDNFNTKQKGVIKWLQIMDMQDAVPTRKNRTGN